MVDYLKEPQQVRVSCLEAPDPFREVAAERTAELRAIAARGEHALVVDFGAGMVKAGWSVAAVEPEVVFRPVTSKGKEGRTQVGANLQVCETLKNYFKNPYERNIVVRPNLLEHCHDYILSQLGHVDPLCSRVLLSEPPANTAFSRQSLLEQYFRCYHAPSVLLGVSPLFAYFFHLNCSLESFRSQSALLIEVGARATHVLPVLRGKADFRGCRRLNVGASDGEQLFVKTIQLRLPGFKDQLKGNLVSFYRQFCFVARDFKLQQQYFLRGKHLKEAEAGLREPVQFMLQVRGPPAISEEELARREQVRRRMGERLREAIEKKKREREEEGRQRLAEMVALQQLHESNPEEAEQEMRLFFGADSIESLGKLIRQLKIKLKMEVEPEEKVSYLEVPDEELAPPQLRLKRIQQFHKQAAETRAQKKLIQQQLAEEEARLKRENLPAFLAALYETRADLKRKIEATQKLKADLSNRSSSLNQRRMQTLAAFADERGRGEAFGLNDEDWEAYRLLGSEQDEDLNEKLMKVELELRENDPDFELKTAEKGDPWGPFQDCPAPLLMNELVRGPESLFQPGMVGTKQAGLAEILELVFRSYHPDQQAELAQNVVLLGGGSQLQGLRERLYKEVQAVLLPGTLIRLRRVEDPANASFRGMQGLATKYPQFIQRHSLSRGQYLREGGRGPCHQFSNPL